MVTSVLPSTRYFTVIVKFFVPEVWVDLIIKRVLCSLTRLTLEEKNLLHPADDHRFATQILRGLLIFPWYLLKIIVPGTVAIFAMLNIVFHVAPTAVNIPIGELSTRPRGVPKEDSPESDEQNGKKPFLLVPWNDGSDD